MADEKKTTRKPKTQVHANKIISIALTADPAEMRHGEKIRTYDLALQKAVDLRDYDAVVEVAKRAKAAGI